jgi:hypothetical protein
MWLTICTTSLQREGRGLARRLRPRPGPDDCRHPAVFPRAERRVEESTARNDKDKHEALGDGGNLWPSAEIWSGATEFVSLPEDTNIIITSHVQFLEGDGAGVLVS